MSDQPPTDVGQVLLGQACKEIRRVSKLSTSYSRSIGEAARRGDEATLEAHLKQLRLCCVAMIKTYKDYQGGKADGEGVAEAGGSSHAHREDQRSGDVVA